MSQEELNRLANEIWERNWENAKKFFNSKGNFQIKVRLKDKWYDKFFNDLDKFGMKTLKEIRDVVPCQDETGRKN